SSGIWRSGVSISTASMIAHLLHRVGLVMVAATSRRPSGARWEERMWQQVYDPFGNSLLSTLAAAIPVVTLLVLIATGAVRTHLAALIALAFGAFFEGASGFGTPVAVTAAILIGLGFSPLAASGLSLIANTAPVAYGALGTPIAGLASVTGLDPYLLGAMVGRQLPF